MSDCSNHKREVAGISDMEILAEMIGDLHYETFTVLLYRLTKKLEKDSMNDNNAGREKLASALQYAGLSLFESACRMERVWNISKPFMEGK